MIERREQVRIKRGEEKRYKITSQIDREERRGEGKRGEEKGGKIRFGVRVKERKSEER